ncbi:ketoacyl-synt-domain-containing protein [Daldinia caldariorum]|uniref:ketoacyl-synt-domain-containing protein n=1 Tax=Daldinia caldariorum TaxID=326644 RepID=UPI002007FAA7|nr:ketoacyl-synt-domain-containing protein [Daldinia caldariorum]KAI1471785.1 ketoacyl-synt-domain-containing protein [Daldinia caldariorum]
MAYKKPVTEPIAVVGVSCRFAGGATSPAKLWDVLCDAPDLSREVPPERFSAEAFYHPDGEYHGTTNSIKAYWLDQDHRVFDANMFNITPKEAEAIDPQQRLILEVVYEALESAGYSLNTYSGKNVAVFSGVMTADYDTLSQRDELSTSQYYATGNARSIISNRISYFYNFQGPSMTIDTACSSSLVALHQAVLSLRSGESIMACVTGTNIMMTPEQFLVESSLHMLSPTGRSRMWDAAADGYARGEGIAAFLLKPLSRALAEGDEITAVIRDTGVNSDGRTKGITLPNPQAQTALIKDTYLKTGLDLMKPEDRCQYFEAHGTGTPAGDPREAEAIYNAFFDDSTSLGSGPNAKSLLVGSVKTVLGHTEGAAGLAGLLKVIEAMKNGAVPPNLHLDKINPDVERFCKRLEVPTSLIPWPRPLSGQPKRASVNSFGFGGANAHVIVESYEPLIHDRLFRNNTGIKLSSGIQVVKKSGGAHLPLPLLLSAGSQKSLRAVVESYRDYILQHPDVDHAQLAWSLYSRRTALPYRLPVSTSSTSQALQALNDLLKPTSNITGTRSSTATGHLKIIGVFTGQGAQWTLMSRSLFRTNEIYRNAIRDLDVILRSCRHPPTWTLEEQILAEGNKSLVDTAAVSQPLCTALQIGLVKLLRSLGITFHTVIGHSSGEIAAAYVAGRLSSHDAILISYYRGYVAHLAGNADGQKGGMLAAGMSEAEALEFCETPLFKGRLQVAANNASSSVTLSGDVEAIKLAHDQLTKDHKFSRPLRVDSAYHSFHMTKPGAKYIEALQDSDIDQDKQGNGVVWISSVHGRNMNGEKLDIDYWKDNMVKMVRFHNATLNAISQQGPFDCALEIGPHPALKGPFMQTATPLGSNILYFSPLDRSKNDKLAFSDLIGALWSHYGTRGADLGAYINFSLSTDVLDTPLIDLPTYPWDHSQIYHRESRISRQFHYKSGAPHELLGVRTRDDNEHELRWRNMLRAEKLPWVEHHSFQGHALLPASAYCIMALDAAQSIIRDRPASVVELQDLQIFSGIDIERESAGVEVMFTLNILPQGKDENTDSTVRANFTLTSCPADGTTSMRLNMVGNLKIYLGEASTAALPSRCASESEAFSATTESFYKMMEHTGLVYTGPFRALTSIQRRYNYCSATLKRHHPEDTTTLPISPATLDSCFQSAFLTYAFPGDRSLWTSFLPVHIERVRFNLTTDKSDNLVVDTHMVDIQPSVTNSKATFDVDISIFNENGDMEIQVEGLRVAALAHTLPKDDYELYLHTVTDLDPSDEIVRVEKLPAIAYDPHDPVLVESCARVATYFVRNSHDARAQSSDLSLYYEKLAQLFPIILGTVGPDSWSSDTKASIDQFVERSNYYDRLNLIRTLESHQPDSVLDILQALVSETNYMTYSHQHVGRIAKQIAHRYPNMNILSLVGPESELLVEVLSALDSSYSSFTIGARTAESLGQHVNLEGSSGKVVRSTLDLSADLKPQLGQDNVYDLVLLSASELDDAHAPGTLKNISAIMRPGGFLLLVQFPKRQIQIQPLQALKRSDDRAEAPTPPQWPDALDAYGFAQIAKNCNQSYYAGYSIMVRQLSSPEVDFMGQSTAAKHRIITDHLLIIGGKDSSSTAIAKIVRQNLLFLCNKVTFRDAFDSVDSDAISSCTAAIILTDLDKPLMSNMTKRALDQLRELLRPNMKVMWITCNARFGNPDHAATFGFTRTVSAEIPSLTLQMLDLDRVTGSRDLITDNFIRLMTTGKDSTDVLWIDEREIHVENGRRIIPRVVPLKASNDKVNSLRRVVSTSGNTLKEAIEVIPCALPGGVVRYEAKLGRDNSHDLHLNHVSIRVDYSSVVALNLNLGNSLPAYLCLGQDLSTGACMMAISQNNSSCLRLLEEHVHPIQKDMNIGPRLISLSMRYLIADMVAAQAGKQRVVLIDADLLLFECVKEVVPGRVIWYTTTKSEQGDAHGALFLHPRTSAWTIKGIFPPSGAVIFDLQSQERTKLSQQISELLPANCKYYPRSTLLDLRNTSQADNKQDYFWKTGWRVAVMRALGSNITDPQRPVEYNTVSLPDLQSSTEIPSSLFNVLDWRANRNAELTIKYFATEQLFRADRTYVLVGLTKDFGQSLCYLLLKYGARNIVLASRNPKTDPKWIGELSHAYDAKIEVRKCDVTNLASVREFKDALSQSMPPVGGVANGAMVLDDRVFAQMDIDTWERVLRPKTVGSHNLHTVFNDPNLEFFIMTSSFAAIGGHPGQSNYAAANMYMNGLAGMRRQLGLAGSVLNIGVIYGIGFLQREKEELYAGLEREGYPPISERDIHHMFIEAVLTGRPGQQKAPIDLTTGLRRFDPSDSNPLHWHQDPRFGHYTRQETEDASAAAVSMRQSVKDIIQTLTESDALSQAILPAFTERLQTLLQLPEEAINSDQSISELGVDSLAAVEIRGWIFKTIGKDVSVIKLLGGTSIQKLCLELAEQILADRKKAEK